MDQIRSKVNDELWILNFSEQWYTNQINLLCNWLSDRLDRQLHVYQCSCLVQIIKVIIYPDLRTYLTRRNFTSGIRKAPW